jgi:hypothetical protein
MIYRALSNIRHNGETYSNGDLIHDMKDEEATELIRDGIVDISENTAAQPTADEVAQTTEATAVQEADQADPTADEVAAAAALVQ